MPMSIESVSVGSIMTKGVRTANPSQPFKAVANVMSLYNIGSVVISDAENGLPAGIITEKDIVRIAGTSEVILTQLVASDIMSKPVITINPKGSVKDAIQTMQLRNIRRLPVVDNEKKTMVGIVTDSDIFRAIMRSQTMIITVNQSVIIEQYRPVYERLSEFMLDEMLLPSPRSGNQ